MKKGYINLNALFVFVFTVPEGDIKVAGRNSNYHIAECSETF